MDIQSIRQEIGAYRQQYEKTFQMGGKVDLHKWIDLTEELLNAYEIQEAHLKRYIQAGKCYLRWDPSFGFTLNLLFRYIHYCKFHGFHVSKKAQL